MHTRHAQHVSRGETVRFGPTRRTVAETIQVHEDGYDIVKIRWADGGRSVFGVYDPLCVEPRS